MPTGCSCECSWIMGLLLELQTCVCMCVLCREEDILRGRMGSLTTVILFYFICETGSFYGLGLTLAVWSPSPRTLPVSPSPELGLQACNMPLCCLYRLWALYLQGKHLIHWSYLPSTAPAPSRVSLCILNYPGTRNHPPPASVSREGKLQAYTTMPDSKTHLLMRF